MRYLRSFALPALAIIGSASAFASTSFTFFNNSGGNSYEAIFTLDSLGAGNTGDLTVQLLNLQTAPADDTGLISGVAFTLNGTPGTILKPTSYSGGEVATPNSNGTLAVLYSALTSLPAANLRWQNISGSNTNIQLSTLSGGQPNQLIMAALPQGQTVYDNGSLSPSITNHAPDIIGSATFVFSNVAGIGASTVVSAVTFGQGTTTGTETSRLQSTVVTATPEPETSALFGVGLLGFGFLARKRSRNR